MKLKNKKNENENKQSCDNLCNLVVRKRKMLKDERGQWIISAGFLVSVSIIILALLLNQAMMGGYQSSGAILEFPKHEIRELVQETHREVNVAAEKAWNMSGEPIVTGNVTNDEVNRTAMRINFTNITLNYTNSVKYLYATHGQMVYMNISAVNFSTSNGTANKILSANVTILFSDGVTTCTFDPELIEIPGVPEQVPGPYIETLYAVNLSWNGCNITSPGNAYNVSDNVSANISSIDHGGTINATINDSGVGVGNISSVKFKIRLGKVGTWTQDKINISYSPDAGGNWSTVDSFVELNDLLTWYGNYTATEVNTWGEVNNMTIGITGIAHPSNKPVDGNLSIDAYHVYVVYEVSP